jgi:hypothetical protein
VGTCSTLNQYVDLLGEFVMEFHTMFRISYDVAPCNFLLELLGNSTVGIMWALNKSPLEYV